MKKPLKYVYGIQKYKNFSGEKRQMINNDDLLLPYD